MLRISPPPGEFMRLFDDDADGRAEQVKQAALMEVDAVSVDSESPVAPQVAARVE